MRFITVENNKITGDYCGDPETITFPNKQLQKLVVPDDFTGIPGQDIREFYPETLKLRPLEKRVADALVTIPDDYKLKDGKLILLTDREKMKKGLLSIPEGFKLEEVAISELNRDGLMLVQKTVAELLSEGIITPEKAYELEIAKCHALRLAAYSMESDGLFFDFQRGIVSKDVWENKIKEIKERYPKPDVFKDVLINNE